MYIHIYIYTYVCVYVYINIIIEILRLGTLPASQPQVKLDSSGVPVERPCTTGCTYIDIDR